MFTADALGEWPELKPAKGIGKYGFQSFKAQVYDWKKMRGGVFIFWFEDIQTEARVIVKSPNDQTTNMLIDHVENGSLDTFLVTGKMQLGGMYFAARKVEML